MFGKEKCRHQIAPASFFSLSTSSATDLDLDAGLAHRRFGGLDNFEPRLDVDAVIGGALVVDRLFLRLHDVRQRRVARLVQAQIGGHDRGHFQLHGLQAAVDLARHHQRIAFDRHLGRERALRPAEQRGQHLAGLVAVVVDGLLAHDDETGLFRIGDRLEDFRHRQRLDGAVGLDQNAAVGAHRERSADRFAGLRRADRNRDDLGCFAGLLQPDRFFDRDLVERIHRHFDVAKFDARAI